MVNLLQWLFHVIPRFPTPLLETPANIVVIFLFIRKSQDLLERPDAIPPALYQCVLVILICPLPCFALAPKKDARLRLYRAQPSRCSHSSLFSLCSRPPEDLSCWCFHLFSLFEFLQRFFFLINIFPLTLLLLWLVPVFSSLLGETSLESRLPSQLPFLLHPLTPQFLRLWFHPWFSFWNCCLKVTNYLVTGKAYNFSHVFMDHWAMLNIPLLAAIFSSPETVTGITWLLGHCAFPVHPSPASLLPPICYKQTW